MCGGGPTYVIVCVGAPTSHLGGPTWVSVCLCVGPTWVNGVGGHPSVVWGSHMGQRVCVWLPLGSMWGGAPTSWLGGPTRVSVCGGGSHLGQWGGGTHQSFEGSHMGQCVSVGFQWSVWGGPTQVSVSVWGSHWGQLRGGHPPVVWGVPHGPVCVCGVPAVSMGGSPHCSVCVSVPLRSVSGCSVDPPYSGRGVDLAPTLAAGHQPVPAFGPA